MKTFLYSIPNKIQSFSKKLDVKAALCGRSWEVFNDEGVKQLFIFNEDGTILITNNGKVLNASWKFIPQNSSIIISSGDETIMFRPAFFNKDVFALQQDGIERYLFMIDEEKEALFPNLSLDALATYIEKEIATSPKDQEEEERMRQDQIELKKIQQEKELQIKKQEEKEWLIVYMKDHKDEIDGKLTHLKRIGGLGSLVCSLSFFVSLCFIRKNPGLIVVIIFAALFFFYFLIKLMSGPIDVLPQHQRNSIRVHNDEEVRKMYEEL